MNPVLRKWSVFLFVVGMGCAWAGCASSRNTSSPGANSERTPAQAENRGKVAFIFDENATEPRILAIESASGNVNVFVCVKSKIISDVLQGEANAVEYVNRYCKREIAMQDEKDFAEVMKKIEDYLAKSKSSNLKKNVVGVAAVLGGVSLPVFGIPETSKWIDVWAKNVSTKYISNVPTEYFHSRTNWISILFGGWMSGRTKDYTYFKSQEAKVAFEKVMKNRKMIRRGRTALLLTGTAALIVYGSKKINSAEDGRDERELAEAFATTLKDLFENAPKDIAHPSVSLAALFKAFRDAGFAGFGQI